MATSSIFTNVVIKDKKSAERFVAALEASRKDMGKKNPEPSVQFLTDHEAIRRLMAKRKNAE